MLDQSGQSIPSFRRPICSTVSPAPAGLQSSTPHSDTPVRDVLSEARVSIEPSVARDLDPDETMVKIVVITRKDPDPGAKGSSDSVSDSDRNTYLDYIIICIVNNCK